MNCASTTSDTRRAETPTADLPHPQKIPKFSMKIELEDQISPRTEGSLKLPRSMHLCGGSGFILDFGVLEYKGLNMLHLPVVRSVLLTTTRWLGPFPVLLIIDCVTVTEQHETD